MSRRKKLSSGETEGGAHGGAPGQTPAALRVLIVSAEARGSARVAKNIAAIAPGACCELAHTLQTARAAIGEYAPELAIIDSELPDGCGFELARELSSKTACAVMMAAAEATFDEAMQALRAGALDMVPKAFAAAGGAPFSAAVARVLERTAHARRREERMRRLSGVCRKLSESRREMSTQVASLCGDMVQAFQEMSDQVEHMRIASEFKGLIRQELDVESLLRTALEYVLARCGSTNAAVFLPSGEGEYSLGAYVNYDCPKEAFDMMLEHLAGIVAPKMEDCTEMRVLASEGQLSEFLGDDAHWLAECGAVMVACRDKDECHAVVILFRDRRMPFSETALLTLRTISGIFGEQLSRIVRIHHRHLPKEQWGIWGGMGLTDEGEDDIDLAA